MEAAIANPLTDTAALNVLLEKMDALQAQVNFLTAEARAQQRAREEWHDLRADMTPVANEAFNVAVRQLSELEKDLDFARLTHLFKRLLRNTENLEQMLEQLESVADLSREMGPLSNDAFATLMWRLDDMERKGYFTFARGGLEMADQIVTNFDEDDVRQLSDNIVLILQTVKEMTQPEIMRLLRSTAGVMRESEPADTSLRSLLGQMRDPATRRGLARFMQVLRTLGEE